MLTDGYDDAIFLPEPLIGIDFARQQDKTHLLPHRFRTDGGQAGQGKNALFGFSQELMAGLTHAGPFVPLLEVDGCGYAKVGGRVYRSHRSEVVLEARNAGRFCVPAVADD